MFIDPGSKSSGWAIFDGKKFIQSGTIIANKDLISWIRLSDINAGYYKLFSEWNLKLIPTEAYIERLVRNTHIITHYSVAVIAQALSDWNVKVSANISISSWQKAVDWKNKRKILSKYKKIVKSEDELAAIGMGLYWTSINLNE